MPFFRSGLLDSTGRHPPACCSERFELGILANKKLTAPRKPKSLKLKVRRLVSVNVKPRFRGQGQDRELGMSSPGLGEVACSVFGSSDVCSVRKVGFKNSAENKSCGTWKRM